MLFNPLKLFSIYLHCDGKLAMKTSTLPQVFTEYSVTNQIQTSSYVLCLFLIIPFHSINVKARYIPTLGYANFYVWCLWTYNKFINIKIKKHRDTYPHNKELLIIDISSNNIFEYKHYIKAFCPVNSVYSKKYIVIW